MRISAKLVTVLAMVALSGALPHVTAFSDPPHLHHGLLHEAAAIAAQDDVDSFMEKVLEKREINWDQVYNYVFGEVEKLRISGVEIAALQSFDQEYTWYVRDGYLVRSPWKINGVEVDDETREKEELQWIERVKDEDEKTRIERDSFFNFEFKPGNYLFAGREMLLRVSTLPLAAAHRRAPRLDDHGPANRRRLAAARDPGLGGRQHRELQPIGRVLTRVR